MIMNYARCAMAKAAFNKKKILSPANGLKFNEETIKMPHFEHSFASAGTWSLRKIDQKYLEILEIWCWKRRRRSAGPIV
jgi:hypothetical protein